MSDDEFVHAAEHAAADMSRLDRAEAVAYACRGSGNPAMLAWLAETVELDPGSRVLDIGSGLGGPGAWFTDHYGCAVVGADPVLEACNAARRTFALPSVAAAGDALPFTDGAFDVCVLLGVLSVVDRPAPVLAEAARLAPSLVSITYTSTAGGPVEVGDSRFLPRSALHDLFAAAGWRIDAGPERPSLPTPPSWHEEQSSGSASDDERAVARAIGEGRIGPVVLTAVRD